MRSLKTTFTVNTVLHRLGASLIAAGLLTLGFAGWQLYGTGLATARSQSKLETRFEEVSAALSSQPPVTVASTTTTPTTSTTLPPTSTSSTPEVTTSSSTTVAAPTTTQPPQTTIVTVTQSTVVPARATTASNWFKVKSGDPVARIQIAALGVDAYVIAGVDKSALEQGPGHHPESVLPGQIGNSVIAGHRTTYGSVFSDVDRLTPGDQIVVTIPTGDRYVYTVTFTEVVAPDAAEVVLATTEDAQLTLLTCTPKYTSESRLLVHAVLDYNESSVPWEAPPDPVTQYTDIQISQNVEVAEEPLPQDTVPVQIVDQVTGDTVTVNIPASVSPDEVKVVDGEVVLPPTAMVTTRTVEVDVTEGFNTGWFEDRGATLKAITLLLGMIVFWFLVKNTLVKRLRAKAAGSKARLVLMSAALLPFVVVGAVVLWQFYTAVGHVLPGSM